MAAPQETRSLASQARRALRKGEATQAAELFKQALQETPDCLELQEGLAAASFMAKDYPQAIAAFTRISQLDPTRGKALINLGAVYNRTGEYQQAIDVLRKGLGKERNCPQGFYNLGLAYRGLEQWAMAVSAYREAIRLAPEMAEAHQNLANVYMEMGNNQQAVLHYRKALEIDPGFERARRGLAKADSAIAQARESISPFGRLVNAPTPKGAQEAQTARQLTQEERDEDRATVLRLTTELGDAAKELVDCLRNELDRHALQLNRTISQGDDSSSQAYDAHTRFRRALAHFQEVRGTMTRSMQQLRRHEEQMRSPQAAAEQ